MFTYRSCSDCCAFGVQWQNRSKLNCLFLEPNQAGAFSFHDNCTFGSVFCLSWQRETQTETERDRSRGRETVTDTQIHILSLSLKVQHYNTYNTKSRRPKPRNGVAYVYLMIVQLFYITLQIGWNCNKYAICVPSSAYIKQIPKWHKWTCWAKSAEWTRHVCNWINIHS